LWIIHHSCGVGDDRGKAGDGMPRQTPQWGEMGDVLVSQIEGGGSEGMPAIVLDEIKKMSRIIGKRNVKTTPKCSSTT
jgi:hypothetical protein